MPEANGDCFQIFIDELSKTYNDSLNIILIDNAAYHKAKKLIIPDNIVLLPIPPYSPELNPIERFWQDVKDKISFSVFKDLSKMRDKVDKVLCSYSKEQLKSLTGYDYIVNGL
jgi:transposase